MILNILFVIIIVSSLIVNILHLYQHMLIVKMIEAFEKDCEEYGYTDTGDVWEILTVIKTALK